MKRYLVILLFGILAFSGIPSTVMAATPQLKVLATTFPIYHLAQRIVGQQEGIQVSQLLPVQVGCPHDYVLTPNDMRKLADADVLLVNGLGLEEFLGAPVHKVNPDLKIVDASSGIDGILYADHTENHTHGTNIGRHPNPHVFASPRMMARMALALAEKLVPLFPAGAEQFRTNAQTYADELNSLTDNFSELGKSVKNNRVVIQHDIFDYLARDAGLEVVAVIQSHPGQEPSAAEMLQLVQTIREKHPVAILTEPQYPDKIGQTLSRNSGIPAISLDPVASGPEEAPGDHYLTSMRQNLAVLEKFLGNH